MTNKEVEVYEKMFKEGEKVINKEELRTPVHIFEVGNVFTVVKYFPHDTIAVLKHESGIRITSPISAMAKYEPEEEKPMEETLNKVNIQSWEEWMKSRMEGLLFTLWQKAQRKELDSDFSTWLEELNDIKKALEEK